jgi:hypothetical protein
MPLIVNSEHIVKMVPVDNGYKAVLVLQRPTTEQYTKFIGARFKMGRRNKIEDRSNEERIKFIDSILKQVYCIDPDGNRDIVQFQVGGNVQELNPEVENWKTYVDASWKIAVAISMEGDSAEVETDSTKN